MGERGWGEAEGKNEFAPDFEKSEDSRLHVGRQPHGQFFEYIPPEVAKIKRVDGAGQKAIFEVREGGNDTKSRAGSRHKCFPSGPKKLYTSPTKKDTYGMLGTNIGGEPVRRGSARAPRGGREGQTQHDETSHGQS